MAVTLTAGELAVAVRVAADISGIPGEYLADITRLLATGTAIVEARAPAAPSAVQNQAVILIAGHLLDSPADRRTPQTAFYFSGASEILSHFVSRRAEAV